MLQLFTQIADLLQEVLAYLELDEGYDPESIRSVEIETISTGQCIVSFPEIGVRYFASDWSGWTDKKADWLFSR
jgi:hypothetical protein